MMEQAGIRLVDADDGGSWKADGGSSEVDSG